MKSFIAYAFVLCIVISCNNKTEGTDNQNPAGDTTSAVSSNAYPAYSSLDFPYQMSEPYSEWQQGNPQHTVTVLQSLKSFETSDSANLVSNFADSVDLKFDNYERKVSRDTLAALLNQWRKNSGEMKINLKDWESVISKDKKHEWVTLWYTQSWQDKSGKWDSVSLVNDARIVNGKIAALEEYQRRIPAKK